MTISNRSEINAIRDELALRQTKLFHACQLQDFRSYIELGGIPSRNKLSNSNLSFTVFDTDPIDKKHQLWDKVFGNFSDFGNNFSRPPSKSFPNPYGPIQIILNPTAFDDVSDLAISLRSAGSKNFDRENECLKTSSEFKLLYANVEIMGNATDKFYAFGNTLNERFKRTDCTSPEFNCTVPDEIVPFKHWAYIVVDNCYYGNELLINEVSKLTSKKTFLRKYGEGRAELILELSQLTKTYDCSKATLLGNPNASENLKTFISELNEFHYNRFIKYLTIGTTRA
ncbi:MAG: hypothetical protein KKC24_05795 [Gammaproteobacteria bacterium]|nr:hypothetical protein [Gammaproteobacteria bacterium]MBU0818346.1 hypothetical protein [Gammaproteobacteria bacterium]MBU0843785.1 hypothetical protein [Gammaproteobacteria bacterium]MBU1840680.1 hypothetical protein [Gammaproteobacteria bacterium]